MKVLADEVGAKVCEILGLDAMNVRRITIELARDDVLISVVERFIEQDEAGEIIEVLREQRFVPAPAEDGA